MLNINPTEIKNGWEKGFVLDKHTISSDLVGYNEYGHEVYDTKRTDIGELLYKLKYKADKSVVPEITESVTEFIKNKWKISSIIDGIIPVPPSNSKRKIQPVIEIASNISNILGVNYYDSVLVKIKETSELKNIFEQNKRMEILKDAFIVNDGKIKGKSILLIDDLYRSGATLNTITDILYKQGKVKRVFVLCLTKTRSIA